MKRQVFQTDSTSRWNRFKWGLRILAVMGALLVATFVTMLLIDNTSFTPFKKDFSSAVMADKPYLRNNRLAKEYKGFRERFHEKKAYGNYAKWHDRRQAKITPFKGSHDQKENKYFASWDAPAGIRAGFYVNWDPQAYLSLKQCIGKLNMVLPEWFFINPTTGGLEVRIDSKAYRLMKRAGIPIIPMLSNAYNGDFQPEGISKVLHNPALRQRLIAELLAQCERYDFAGINIDIEELREADNAHLTQFVKETAKAFHAKQLYVTQDIVPFNEDYDVEQLAKHNDYLFLMAYDEHNTMSAPGPVSSQQWIGAATADVLKKVPSDKVVLCLAAYGYDWTAKGDDNQAVAYNDAMSLAADTRSQVNFDSGTYGLDFAYEADGTLHQIHFNDAATNFNTLRFGSEYGLAGFSVWRLGTEDKRLWKFYDKDLSRTGAAGFDFRTLEPISGNTSANYIGTGEVIDLLDTPHDGHCLIKTDPQDWLVTDETYQTYPTCYELQKLGHAGDKELLLTFDDGPDSRWTPQVLKILKEHNVHAAFFMVGLQMEKNLPIVRQAYNDGHFIGNHTFTHRNIATSSPERNEVELRLTRLLIKCITGHSTILFRAPYNADSDPSGADELLPLVVAHEQNYLDIGEAIDPNDWEVGVTADQIYDRVMKGVALGYGHIILLHDAGGTTRKPTLEALPRIISDLKAKGYTFITLDKYLGKTRDELMPPIPKDKTYYVMQANLLSAECVYYADNFVAALFVLFMVIGFLRIGFMFCLTLKERRKERALKAGQTATPEVWPLVSIIVPAYNEEVDAVSSLENLLRQDYPNFDIVFVDDGSRDHTYERVCEAFKDNPKMRLLTKENGGKASALNHGIAHTTADYIVCIDADTKLRPDAVSIMMRHFFADREGKVGAVAGNVKVGNQCNLLTRWQAIEYTTSQNFDRLAYSAINAITVVPGAIGAFRKRAIEDAGGLTTDTLAEDCDLTIRILRAGYVIENENRAVALTEAPENLRQFVKQRTRWCFGIMQTFWKNRDAMFIRRYKGLGLWALPNMLLFQFIIPTVSPLADVLMILGLFSGNAGKVLLYYLLFLLVDAGISIMAYFHEREKPWVLFWIIPQRLCYRWIMYFVLFKSYKKAIKGELQSWGVLKRTGNVKTTA